MVKGLSSRKRKSVDVVAGITKPTFRRLARRGGVKRISANLYPESQKYMNDFVHKIIKDAVILAEHSKRKTLTTRDILEALKHHNSTLYFYDK